MRVSPQYECALALLAGPEAAGDGFMDVAAEALSLGLGLRCAGIVLRSDDGLKARTLAWHLDGLPQAPVEYDLPGTPCADVYASSNPNCHVFIPEGVQDQFPNDRMLVELGVVSYWAEGFVDKSRQPLGHVFVMDDAPLPENVQALSFFRLVAQRVGAEFNRARAEIELRRSEQRLKDFASTAADWFWETDPAGRFTFYAGPERYFENCRILGMTRSEFARIDSATNAAYARHLEDVEARRPFRDFCYSTVFRGRLARFSISGEPVFDEAGKFAGYRGTSRDVSAPWQAQLRLEASAERLEGFLRVGGRLAASTVVESQGLAAAARELTETVAREMGIERVSLWIATPDGGHLHCLDRFLAATGRHDSGHFVPARSMRAMHGSAVVAIADVSTDPRAAYLRDDYLTPEGITSMMDADIWREGRFVGSLVFARGGEPHAWTEEEQVFAGFLAQYAARLIEADARIQAEHRLRDSEALHRALIENAHDDISVVGRDGIVRFHSSSSLYRRSTVEAGPVGRKLTDLVHPDDRGIAGSLLTGNEGPVLTRVPGPDGSWMAFELTGRDMAADPVVGGVVLTWRDVTERLANLEALRVAKEEAELANRLKSSFLANVSHELRTPLNAVLGFSEIIRDQLLGRIEIGSYVEYANDIHDSGTHLLGVINGILDLSKIEAGREEVSATDVDLVQALESCLRLVERRAQACNVRLECRHPEKLPALLADERHIRQILLNLLSNAVKFAGDGGDVCTAIDIGRDGSIEIIVSDTGIGMAPEEILIALSPFGQVENAYSRRYEGTGLGLPLSKALTELNGGRLEIESHPGRGTRVRILFPPERTLGERAPDGSAAPVSFPAATLRS